MGNPCPHVYIPAKGPGFEYTTRLLLSLHSDLICNRVGHCLTSVTRRGWSHGLSVTFSNEIQESQITTYPSIRDYFSDRERKIIRDKM